MSSNTKTTKKGDSQPLGVLAKATPMFNPLALAKNHKPKQSELFIRSRNPMFQYAIDVFALAFTLAILFVILERFFR